jgi:hypothetical protein
MTRKIAISLNVIGLILCFFGLASPLFWSYDLTNNAYISERMSDPDGPTAVFITMKISKEYIILFLVLIIIFALNIYAMYSKKGLHIIGR